MKLLFAQGNPGDEYTNTRHNIGWRVLDAFAREQGVLFAPKTKFHAEIAESTIAGEKVLLAKPTTYYNESGQSIRAIIDFYKLDPTSDILVLHDELALQFGTVRLRPDGSDAGNNGIKSITRHIGGTYWRLRIGIANTLLDRIDAHDFVLSKFTKDEDTKLPQIIKQTHDIITAFVADTHEAVSQTID